MAEYKAERVRLYMKNITNFGFDCTGIKSGWLVFCLGLSTLILALSVLVLACCPMMKVVVPVMLSPHHLENAQEDH